MSGRGRASRAKRRGSRVWGKVFSSFKRHGHVKSKKLNAKVRQKCRGLKKVSPGTKREEKALRIQEEFGESWEGEISKHDSVWRYQCAAVHDGKSSPRKGSLGSRLPLTHL